MNLPSKKVTVIRSFSTAPKLTQAVRAAKEPGISWLFLYYAGHSVAIYDDAYGTIIEPQRDEQIYLVPELTRILRKEGRERIKALVFMDSCARQGQSDVLSDYDLQGDEPLDNVVPMRSCRFGDGLIDGCLFERALEHCLRHEFQDPDTFRRCVGELARQLPFGRLCSYSDPVNLLTQDLNFLLSSQQTAIFENFVLLNFALDCWTEQHLLPDDAVVSDAIGLIRSTKPTN